MKYSDGIRWFVRGFMATVFMLAVVFYVGIGNTQDGGNASLSNLAGNATELDATTAGYTDDPLGRVFIPLADETLPESNLEYGLGEDVVDWSSISDTFAARTDESLPESNLDYELDEEREDGALMRDRAAQREAEYLRAGQYVSPLVISAADFAPDGANPDSLFFPFGGGYFQGSSENYGCLVAPVYLPDGVTVTDLFATVYDDDNTFNLTINLRRVDNFNGGTVVLADASTSGEFAGVQVVNDFEINEPLIIYPDYSYYLTTCLLSGSIRLYSARIYYEG